MARGILAMFGAGPARLGAPVKPNCPYCFCLGWVCENHPHLGFGSWRVVPAASRDNAIASNLGAQHSRRREAAMTRSRFALGAIVPDLREAV